PYFEGMDYDGIKQLMQMFVYEMTQMMVARGGQVVFSSVQLSPGVPTLWKDKPCVFRGKVWDGNQAPLRTYGEFEREVRLLFKALMEVMLDGDYWGKPFSFPKPEISIEPDFLTEDEEFNRSHPDLPTYRDLYLMTFELASKYGTPYYDNQIPAYRGAGEGISCYQCLAGDELVPVADREGRISVKRIQDIFDTAAKNGRRIDTFGTELAYYDGRTPSVDFETLEASLRPFHGVMRRRYSGPLLHITLESGRAITVTPDHPVYVLDGDVFVRDVAGELNVGDCLPVLKTTGFCERAVEEIEVAETLDTAGYGDSIRVTWDGVTLRTSGRISLPRVLPASSELARLLGYYLAAGRSECSARRYTVRFTFEEGDAEIAADTTACIRAVLGVEPQVLETASGTAVVISSRLIYLLFAALGCGSADADKSVPD
ncbi:MAG TPA: anaerobic ribonucleoside-triphosphate reductase, partial [Methanoculleus sp.]|nr:anaerobic ribonucleoside-triphosphate reductase [Methanoculleus sp.]